MPTVLFRSLALLIPVLLLGAPVVAQEGGARIGIAAPLSGSSEILGRQIVAGAREIVGSDDAVVPVDNGCTAETGTESAKALVEARVAVAVGFLCAASLETALPILKAAAIPAINVGVRAERVLRQREKDGALVWRLAPGTAAEAEALARFVRERWSAQPFALIEDGTPYARDLADTVRQSLEQQGIRPALIDNYRPAEEKQFAIARRLSQSGVGHALILGTRSDIAIILRDAAEVGLSLEAASGESLFDETENGPALAEGAIAVVSGFDVDWPPSETAPVEEGYARIAAVGTEIAVQAAKRAWESSRSIADVLNTETFATSAGMIRFDVDGTADVVPFRTYRWDGTRFVAETQG
ncbi:ABC transporter substrate-binding protein [Aureimonas sp. ME7]|uniref:ABC transporter substrate-binding protein n=1 Tax=Aureimonas sp. ME7 TaxID=2744252 RepID=UPI001FCEEC7E|nr:ABC transporter substrate-binding protein [Aureimonas sp. ME7]